MFHFYISWKHHKTGGFLIFTGGGKEVGHWLKMDSIEQFIGGQWTQKYSSTKLNMFKVSNKTPDQFVKLFSFTLKVIKIYAKVVNCQHLWQNHCTRNEKDDGIAKKGLYSK